MKRFFDLALSIPAFFSYPFLCISSIRIISSRKATKKETKKYLERRR